jgi:hypothetical protein
MVTRLAVVCGVVLLISGCNPPLIEVQGEVQLDGTPVETGSISFEPANGQGSEFGAAILAGRYQALAPPSAGPGTHIVRIRASRPTGRQIPAGPPHPPSFMIDELKPVSAAYNVKSTLTADLTQEGPNRVDFSLESDP